MDPVYGVPVDDVSRLVQLIQTLYTSDNTANQAEANKQLTELQATDKMWGLCWPLLDLDRAYPVEVSFFAANALVQKINQTWYQQDQNWLESDLRPKLFDTIVKHASSDKSPRLVVERLSLALATFALHAIPTFWPDAIEYLLLTLTSQDVNSSVPSQKISEILLKILIYIPEEYSVQVPTQEHRAKLNGQVNQAAPMVYKFLRTLLVAGENHLLTSECRQTVLKCITSWSRHSKCNLLGVEEGPVILDLLYNHVLHEDFCSGACAALASTFTVPRSEKYRNSVINFLPRLADLKQAIDKYICSEEIECAIKIYSLVINFSENHSKLFINIILEHDIEIDQSILATLKPHIFNVLRIILDCTSAPRIYGVDEKYSDLSFPFWFSFFENFYYYSDSLNDRICESFNPLVDSLLTTLIKKSQYPALSVYQSWNDDQREAYRCYRQDIGDNISLIVQFPRARERVLDILHNKLTFELKNLMNPELETPWQGFEAVIFALKSVAEYVHFDEVKYIPGVFNILSQVPFNESHALLYCTVAEMIPAFSDWLYMQSSHLATAFNMLFLGVNSTNAHVRLMSTLSLKDLTTECQSSLHPFAAQVVESCISAILQHDSILTTNEKSRLVHTIGTTLAISPYSSVMAAMKRLTTPIIEDLLSKSILDPETDATCRAVIIDRLSMINSLIESLYIKPYSGNEYEHGDENSEINVAAFESPMDTGAFVQPCLALLKQITPIITDISTRYQRDEDVMLLITQTIKRSAKSLGLEIKPLLQDMLSIVVRFYDPTMNTAILDGCLPYYLLFRVDKTVHPMLRDAFVQISNRTLESCFKNNLKQLSVTIEHFFKFTSAVCRKFPDYLLDDDENPSINIEFIFKLAVASLELPEKRTIAEASNFLIIYLQKTDAIHTKNRIFVNHLGLIVENIFNSMAGVYSTPRNAMEGHIDLLFLIVEDLSNIDYLHKMGRPKSLQTEFVSEKYWDQFIRSIVLERNRRKFKDACSEFVIVARNLNRST